jgi:N-acetylglucosamine kinase-like BadF-type ATPase
MDPIPEQRDSIAESSRDLLLAVDAGGTKTAAWLVDLNQPEPHRILGRGRASAGNPLSVGVDEATRAVTDAIVAARNDANNSGTRVGRLILSMAGAANEAIGKQFVDWVRSLGLAERVAVVADVLPVLAAGAAKCVGVAVIAGTGSVAFGRNAEGKTQLCGGWGYLLGDEGSGYSIGQMGLSHALKRLERYSVLDPLTAELLKALSAETVMQVTKAIYTAADPRATIASLAPIVVNFAEGHMPDAMGIVGAAGMQLAELVARTMDLLGLTNQQFSLAVGGGLLVNAACVRDALKEWLQKYGIECEMTVVDESLVGCIRLAAPEFDGTLVKWHPT